MTHREPTFYKQTEHLRRKTTPILKYLKPINIDEKVSGMEPIDCVYVINLDLRFEQWERMQALLQERGIHANRVTAINGWELPKETAKELAGPYPVQLQGGALGCLLSHVSIYKDAFDRGFKTIWVMEDDVEFLGDIREIPTYLKTLTQVDPEWGIFYTDFESRDDVNGYFMFHNEIKRPDQKLNPSWYYCLKELACDGIIRTYGRYGTMSMLISKIGIEKLLYYFTHVYLYLPVDHDIHYIPQLKKYVPAKEIVTNLRNCTSSDTKLWSTLNKQKAKV